MSKRKPTIAELQAELEKAMHEKKITEQNIRILEHRQKELTRRERTHRLCVHGGMLERYLKPDEFTDKEIAQILQTIFSKKDVQALLEKFKNPSPSEQSPS